MPATIPGRVTKPATPTATIANAASLSDAVDLAGLSLVGLLMPAAWTAASITFQVSFNGTDFFNVHDAAGTEYTVTTSTSRYVILPKANFEAIRYIKVRSGTSGAAVAQGAECLIKLVAVDI